MNLVTGATGLLGSHIVEQLRRRGRPVRVLVRRGSDTRWLATQGVEIAHGDLTDAAALAAACAGASCVYHAAARVGDWGPWAEFQQITIDGSRKLFDAIERARVPRLVHVSSISVYGHVNGEGREFDETAPLGQNLYRWSYYTRAKVAVERLLWERKKQIAFSIIRPSWLYGPRDRATVARMVNLVSCGKAKLLGDGANRLNMVYAGNVAEACILAADNPRAVHEAYNACNDGIITQRRYYELVAQALGCPPVTRRVPYGVAYRAAFLMECFGHLFRTRKPPMVTRYSVWLMGRRAYFLADKARRDLGWNSTIGYEEGIPLTIRWYQSQSAGAAPRGVALANV
ncbi:MAG: NAD-dependent epimerase/dehydratase family protein [Phycisphaerae bacterium]